MTLPKALRVLYLEDNPVDADLVRRELARQAPELALELVPTLDAARKRLVANPPPYDLVLVDMALPGCSMSSPIPSMPT